MDGGRPDLRGRASAERLPHHPLRARQRRSAHGRGRHHSAERPIKAVLDPYNPVGSTRYVNFTTTKRTRWQTDPRRSHVNWVICDSDWESELCRVVVRKTDFPWVRRYAALARPNPRVEKEGIGGYELALTFDGVPFQLLPLTPSEIKGRSALQLVSVNEAEEEKNPCGHLVSRRGKHWELTTHGFELISLLLY